MSGIWLRGAADLAAFILANYSGRVIEVGAGFQSDVASLLKDLDLKATDLSDHRLSIRTGPKFEELSVDEDDAFYPNLDLYRDASLIYSIRPPMELQIAIGEIAIRVGADVIVRPLEDEVADLPGFSRSLVNRGEARFYLFKRL
jgi:uncharacterized protein